MLRKLIIFGICAGSSASFPILYQSNPEAVMSYLSTRLSGAPKEDKVAKPTEQAAAEPAAMTTQASVGGRRVSLPSDERGHFIGEFKLNGRKVQALVDTGATAVAMNLSTARRSGIAVTQADLTHSINTANGATRAAVVIIDRLDIGRISVENVQAIVLEDSALDTTLIGMTFLNRLNKFQVDQGSMVLVQ